MSMTRSKPCSRDLGRGKIVLFGHGLPVLARTLVAMSGSEDVVGRGWTDLAGNAPGIGVAYEAARRRQAEGLGADRS